MARFDRTRTDYRGPEYDRRYGRYEHAFARRIALERREFERRERRRRRRRGDRRERGLRERARRGARIGPYQDQIGIEDLAYSRRYWPPAEAYRRHGR